MKYSYCEEEKRQICYAIKHKLISSALCSRPFSWSVSKAKRPNAQYNSNTGSRFLNRSHRPNCCLWFWPFQGPFYQNQNSPARVREPQLPRREDKGNCYVKRRENLEKRGEARRGDAVWQKCTSNV